MKRYKFVRYGRFGTGSPHYLTRTVGYRGGIRL